MPNQERFHKIKQNLKRRALPIAFILGFLASVIAVDPFSRRNPVIEEASKSETYAVETSQNEDVKSSETAGLVASLPSEAEQGGGEIASIGGIDGVSEAGSAHPFDRAYPRAEVESRSNLGTVEGSPGDPVVSVANGKRKPASAAVWEGDDSLQNLKFDDGEPLWNGKAQLLPNPMFVEQLTSRRMKGIRGGGWMAIDLARGEILPVELFKSASANYTSKAVVEARVVRASDGGAGRVLNTVNTGIPVVRGIEGVVSGPYEVPESPACLVRYSVVTTEEVCSAPRPRSAGGSQIRFRFEPPVASQAIPAGGRADPLSEDGDFQFTTVYVESTPGNWVEIGNFNESFTPIGDANRDGYPDFYLETLNDDSASGRHDLLVSSPSGEGVIYTTYSARFIGR